MKKLLLTLSLILVSATYLQAQVVYTYDTLKVSQIAEGVFHYTVHEETMPWEIQVVEVDLSNPDISLETVIANDLLRGYEPVSSMTKRKSYEGHQVIAGVNGDFYGGTGEPTNTQVLKGEILKKPISRHVFGFNDLSELFINTITYNGRVIHGTDTLAINEVNGERSSDFLVFYNHYIGTNTATNQYGSELTLKVLDPWTVNGKVRAVITKKEAGVGGAKLTDSTFVLSGHGTMSAAINEYSLGDTLTIEHELTATGIENITGAVGGNGAILTDGIKTGNWPERHPRTAVAFNKERTKLYLMVVDGRHKESAGMTLQQMGDYLLTIGAYNALNLDGGGSTTMVVHNEVSNRPSGKGIERTVSNGLMVVSRKQKFGNASRLNLFPNSANLYKTESLRFGVDATDANYYPVKLLPEKINFYLSNGFGATISSDGLLTTGTIADTGYVYIEYEGVIDSSLVIIKSVYEMNLHPQIATTDTSRTIEFYTVAHDLDNQTRTIENSELNWIVENPEVGSITEEGVFKGKAAGTTKVIAQYESLADTSTITVELINGVVVLDDFESLDGWSLDGENIDLPNSSLSLTDSISSKGDHSLRVDYEYTYDGNPTIWIHVKKDFTVFGVPDSILVDVISSDERKHLMDAVITDNDGELFNVRVKKYVNTPSFEAFPAYVDDGKAAVLGSNFFFPIHVKGISIKIEAIRENGITQKGTFFLDNLRLVYPDENPVSNELVKGEGVPTEFVLHQNYPNPFNPSTNISFSLPKSSKVELKVFDLLGREVQVLINEKLSSGGYQYTFNANALSSGVYFYQLKTDAGSLSKKMTLIK